MNLPICPPEPSADWSQLIQCWKDVEDFKKMMGGVVNELLLDGTIDIAPFVDQAIQNDPSLVATVQSIVNNYIANNVVPRKGVTDGLSAAPGEIGEILLEQHDIILTSASNTYNGPLLTLTPGDWLITADISFYNITGSNPYLGGIAFNVLTGTVPISQFVTETAFPTGNGFKQGTYPLRPFEWNVSVTTPLTAGIGVNFSTTGLQVNVHYNGLALRTR